jgi:thiamine biosynthesis lipoprotein
MDEYLFSKPLFGKDVEIAIYDMDDEMSEAVAIKAYEEGVRLSKIFNLYDENSELSLLNKDRKMHVSNELLQVILVAKEFYKLTNGTYDVSLGKTIQERKKGLTENITCSFEEVLIEDNFITLNNKDIIIDLGSVAKGYIVDRMVEVLQDEGVVAGLVDGRGDMRIFGAIIQNIGIQHPRDKDKTISKITVSECAIATSGDYNQYIDTFDHSHIINSLDIASITVVGPNLALVDAFATAFFVSKNPELLERYKDLKVMTIDKNLNINYYNGFKELL